MADMRTTNVEFHDDQDDAIVLNALKAGTLGKEIEVTVTVTHSANGDGTLVIFIDTPGVHDGPNGPMMRVHLNDGYIFEGVTYEPRR